MLLLGSNGEGGKVGEKMAYPVFWRRSFFWRLCRSLEGEGREKMFRLPCLSVFKVHLWVVDISVR